MIPEELLYTDQHEWIRLEDDTATVVTITINGGAVRCGAGVTHTTVNQHGGSFSTESNLTTLAQKAGLSEIKAAATLGTANLDGGTCVYRSSGTLTAAVLDLGAPTLDFSQDGRGRTVTDLTLNRGQVLDPDETVTWTNGVQPERGLAAVA